jgi:hypothetical protein
MSTHRDGAGQALNLMARLSEPSAGGAEPATGTVGPTSDAVGPASGEAERMTEGLRKDEHDLRMLAEELGAALEHMERALLAAKGTGFSGRVRETFEAADELQREAAREFGRKVGSRMGRSTLWRVRRGVDLD